MSSTDLSSADVQAFASAVAEDLVFASEELKSHWDRPIRRTGFKLANVAGRPVPPWIRLAYVRGESATERFTYVVLWRTPGATEPEEHRVPSEAAAKEEILQALRNLLEFVHVEPS